MTLLESKAVHNLERDLDEITSDRLRAYGREHGLAVDIETTGLDAREDSIEVVSVATPAEAVVLSVSEKRPSTLLQLLEDPEVPKLFHHALFDLSFLQHHWGVMATPVECTKVAARIAGVALNPHLKDLVHDYLGVTLDKTTQLSDWSKRPLTEEQVRYAAADVFYLHDIFKMISWDLSDTGRSELYQQAMRFLPARVELGLLGLGDVYAYEI